MFIRRQKWHVLTSCYQCNDISWDPLLDNSMSLTFCCSLRYANKLHKHQCSLLSLGKSDAVWTSVVLLTPCPWETALRSLHTLIDRLTHLLLVIWCTTGSFTKNQDWCMSLTSCRLWDKTADHKEKHYSQTVVMRWYIRSMLVQSHLPTDINIIRSCHQEYGEN